MFSYVKAVDLRDGLRKQATVLILGAAFLLLFLLYLFIKNLQLQSLVAVQNAEIAALSTRIDELSDDFSSQQEPGFQSQINSLEIRLAVQENRRLLELPQGTNDLGAAIEGTVQWSGTIDRLGEIEEQVVMHDGLLGPIISSGKILVTTHGTLNPDLTQNLLYTKADYQIYLDAVLANMENYLIAGGLEPRAIVAYNTEVTELGGVWIWPEGYEVIYEGENVQENGFYFVLVSVPAGAEVTLSNPYNSGDDISFFTEAFHYYTSTVGHVEGCYMGPYVDRGSCEIIQEYDVNLD